MTIGRGRLAERNGNRPCLGIDEDRPGCPGLPSQQFTFRNSRSDDVARPLFTHAIRLSAMSPVQASSLSAAQRSGASFVRGHNEGNAAAKLVFDTDCGGIDGNEPLGEALNVSMVNPLLVQPRNVEDDDEEG